MVNENLNMNGNVTHTYIHSDNLMFKHLSSLCPAIPPVVHCLFLHLLATWSFTQSIYLQKKVLSSLAQGFWAFCSAFSSKAHWTERASSAVLIALASEADFEKCTQFLSQLAHTHRTHSTCFALNCFDFLPLFSWSLKRRLCHCHRKGFRRPNWPWWNLEMLKCLKGAEQHLC